MRLAPKYRARVGFVTTPKYFDDAIQEFLKVAPAGVGAIQRVMTIADYSWELTERADGLPEMARSAQALAESHCEVVLQAGSNWVHAAGTSPAEVESVIGMISANIGIPFRMAGHCQVEALRHLGARRVGVANSYYRDDWRDGINRYLAQSGFAIAASGSIIDQGIVGSLDEARAIEAATLWDYPAEVVREAILATWRAAPDVDAICQTGAGFRTIELLADLEAEIGVPIVPSDAAIFWAGLTELGLAARPGFGTLLESTRG